MKLEDQAISSPISNFTAPFVFTFRKLTTDQLQTEQTQLSVAEDQFSEK